VDVATRIAEHRELLSPAERRVADVVLGDPQLVAFGTVAAVADRAGTSGASVVRLANRIGLDGFSELQSGVQAELARRLGRATERIRQPGPADVVARSLATEVDNVAHTLERVERSTFARAVDLLAGVDPAAPGRVYVCVADASSGVASQFGGELGMLRDGVVVLAGGDVAVGRLSSSAGAGDVALVLDLPRYDRTVLDTTRRLCRAGVATVVMTDRALSPLTEQATAVFLVDGAGVGPFDSYVGALALLNALVAGVADRLRASATERLDRVESAWRASGALADG
jgi:DNA-binding MurR/RpiR family transcriptional regulator